MIFGMSKNKNIDKGLLRAEIAQLIYAALTMLLILFTWTNFQNPSGLLWERVTMVSGTIALWIVYRIWPSKVVMLCRVGYLLVMLGHWYPDTYELNKQFGSFDNFFAQYEQDMFGFQPAYIFSKAFSSAFFSEMMYAGYVSYYLFFVFTIFIVFFRDYSQLRHVTFMIITGFFLCYVIYIFMPVTGPQYYFYAIGEESVVAGNFHDIGKFFSETQACLTAPGWKDGFFYGLNQLAHQTGERPTAAFPSSHVAIATLVMLMVARMKMWKWLMILAIPFVLLCFSTVYIQAHYAIDAIAGMIYGILLFVILGGLKLKKCGG